MEVPDHPPPFDWPVGSHLDWTCVDASRRHRDRMLRTLLLPYIAVGGLFGLGFLQDRHDQGVWLAITGTFVIILLVSTPWWVPYCLWVIWRDQCDLDQGREAFRRRYGVDPLKIRPVRRDRDEEA